MWQLLSDLITQDLSFRVFYFHGWGTSLFWCRLEIAVSVHSEWYLCIPQPTLPFSFPLWTFQPRARAQDYCRSSGSHSTAAPAFKPSTNSSNLSSICTLFYYSLSALSPEKITLYINSVKPVLVLPSYSTHCMSRAHSLGLSPWARLCCCSVNLILCFYNCTKVAVHFFLSFSS